MSSRKTRLYSIMSLVREGWVEHCNVDLVRGALGRHLSFTERVRTHTRRPALVCANRRSLCSPSPVSTSVGNRKHHRLFLKWHQAIPKREFGDSRIRDTQHELFKVSPRGTLNFLILFSKERNVFREKFHLFSSYFQIEISTTAAAVLAFHLEIDIVARVNQVYSLTIVICAAARAGWHERPQHGVAVAERVSSFARALGLFISP